MDEKTKAGVDMHYVLVHGDKHRGMEAFRKAKASALHKLLTVAKCHRTVVFCGDEEHASELAQRLTQAGVHATLQDEAAGVQPQPDGKKEEQNQITFVTTSEDLEAGAESANLVAILDPPLQAAAYLRLLQRLPSRSARGLCVIYVAPLEFIDVKNLMALVPGGKVTPLPDVVEQEHYAHFLYNASSRAAPASPLPKQAPAAAGGAQDSSAAGSSATAAESEDTATAHEPNLAATAASSPAPATAGYGSMQAGEKGFEARPGETVETLRELLARRRAELSTKSALEVRAEGGSFGAASNAATAGSSEDGATMATAGSSTTVEQPVRANGHAAAAAEEAVAAAAQQVHAEGDANGVNGASDAELGAEQPPPPPPGDPEPAAQPSEGPLQPTNLARLVNNLLTAEAAPEPEPVQPTNLARLVNQLAADGAPKFDPTEHDPAKDHMSPASRLARLAAAPARLADETPYRDSTATAQQGPGGGNVPARPRPLVPPRSGHAPAPLWSPETPAGGSLGSCPEAAPNVKQERARRGSTEAAARKEEQQELLLERAIQAIHQGDADEEEEEESKEEGPAMAEAVSGQGQENAEAGAWAAYYGADAAAQWADLQRQQQEGWWSGAGAAGAWGPSPAGAHDQYMHAWQQWQTGQQQEGAADGGAAAGQQQKGSPEEPKQEERLVQVPLALLQRYQALEWAEWQRQYERWRSGYEEWYAWFSWHAAAAQQQWYHGGQQEAGDAQGEAPAGGQ